MRVQEGRAEQVGGVVFMVCSLILAFAVIPAQIKAVDAPWYNSPKLFPYVIAGLLFFFGSALAITGTRKAWKRGRQKDCPETDEETYAITGQEAKLVLITLGVVVLYVLAMGVLPYIPCTIVALGLLMWLYGQRSWIKLVSISVLFPLLIYFAFSYLLKLRLP